MRLIVFAQLLLNKDVEKKTISLNVNRYLEILSLLPI